MKDIDFDELDRAVSSLMGAVPKDDSAKNTPQVDSQDRSENVSVTTHTTSPVGDKSEDNRNSENLTGLSSSDASADEQPDTLTTPEPPRKLPVSPAIRRGRFMDVVRPTSQNMKSASSSISVSRRASVVQPMNGSEADTPPSFGAKKSNDTVSDQSDVKVEQSEDNQVEQGIDIERTAPDIESLEDVQKALAEAINDPMPLASPFLPDAKVEKRPLGRSAEAAPTVDLSSELQNIQPENTAQTNGFSGISPNNDAQLPEQPLPAELGSELLSIETSADHLPQEASYTRPAPQATQPAPAPLPASDPSRSSVAVSIPQQYKVQPSKPDEQPAGALYDAQPLAHPAEKKPGWLWIAAIVATILLGVGGGVAVYYLGLI